MHSEVRMSACSTPEVDWGQAVSGHEGLIVPAEWCANIAARAAGPQGRHICGAAAMMTKHYGMATTERLQLHQLQWSSYDWRVHGSPCLAWLVMKIASLEHKMFVLLPLSVIH